MVGRSAAGKSRSAARRAKPARELRIIGGRWRGRRWQFPADTLIRPTPDRVRETLFNWLMAEVPAARCLDLFAGSGALGLEALSRGAGAVTFVEADRAAASAIETRLNDWAAVGGSVVCADAPRWLEQAAVEPMDIAFLDPPFAAGLTPRALATLTSRGWLRERALVYLECAADEPPAAFGAGWSVHRSGRAGEVGYHLLRPPSAAAIRC